MPGRLWSRCLSVWMGKSQRILTWLFLTTFSGSTHQSLLCARLCSAHITLHTIEATLLCFSVLGPCKLDVFAVDMCHGFCILFAQPASWILHSVVDLVCHYPGVEGCWCWAVKIRASVIALMLLLLSHWYVHVPCRQLLTHLWARHHAEASHTRLQLHLALSFLVVNLSHSQVCTFTLGILGYWLVDQQLVLRSPASTAHASLSLMHVFIHVNSNLVCQYTR